MVNSTNSLDKTLCEDKFDCPLLRKKTLQELALGTAAFGGYATLVSLLGSYASNNMSPQAAYAIGIGVGAVSLPIVAAYGLYVYDKVDTIISLTNQIKERKITDYNDQK
ncbi:MAG: hypothetical protein ACMXYL_05805 [Candidatus Woesearchaeota archaeon]